MTVTADQFEPFFRDLWEYEPFPWQRRLAERVCAGHWPCFIDLPTASGKTACLDVAVFALAVQAALPPAERTIGRRIFFVVNRRVIVDEAFERASRLARKLSESAPGSTLSAVAEALRSLSEDDDAPPLDVAILRGGIVRDNRWARSMTQPTIITSTIDQVGSRLLFRGYGVTPEAAPLHAALIAHDSMIFLDEAHISQPFVQTLEKVRQYRGDDWAGQPLRTPFHIVQMTATPGDVDGEVFRLDDDDRSHPVLSARHTAAKLITLDVAKKAKGRGDKPLVELASQLAERAVQLLDEQHWNIAIVVNRVATARKVYELLPELLQKKKEKICDFEPYLAIGRMRPVDRDELTKRIQSRVGPSRNGSNIDNRPMFVVATQCLEVGADFDFDAMVSECASLDALRQRFGRLNRTGRDIEAKGYIVIRADQIKTEDQLNALEKKNEADDPIYGNALARTWNWLKTVAEDNTVDFGIHTLDELLEEEEISPLVAPRPDAPVMFPAYVDAWVQTNPAPVPSPDVSLFLHGPQRGEPDVNVCWREDLDSERSEDWAAVVSLCPPSSPECMPVPIGLVQRWLSEREPAADLDIDRSDFLDGRTPESDEDRPRVARKALIWRGAERSTILDKPSDLKPGDTIVLPIASGGWEVFGHIPDESPKDVAEAAYRQSRGRVILRLRPERLDNWPEEDDMQSLREWLKNPEVSLHRAGQRQLLQKAAELAPEGQNQIAEALRLLASPRYGLKDERYPAGEGVILETRRRVEEAPLIPAMDDGEDEPSRIARRTPVALREHLQHVRHQVERSLRHLAPGVNNEVFGIAAALHDLGKADERFQALLINGDRDDAWAQPMLWAKSARMPSSRAARQAARERSGLPKGFRHEMLSVQLAELSGMLPEDSDERDLVLHLIAAHHGHARPFAPVVIDEDPPDVILELPGMHTAITTQERLAHPPHRLDSGIANRFWKLTRRYGWWGLAYLEAILRLADQQASAAEDKQPDTTETREIVEAAT